MIPFSHKTEGKTVPAETIYVLLRCPKPDDTNFFNNFSCHLSLFLADNIQLSLPWKHDNSQLQPVTISALIFPFASGRANGGQTKQFPQ